MAKWAAVIGSPIEHSLSPVLHRTAYEILGLDWEYRKYQVEADEVASFVAGLDERCVGLSATMPTKQELLKVADTADGLATAVGAANTLVRSSEIQVAFNTDVHGIVEAVLRTLQLPLADARALNQANGARAVIIGTGATASSALAATTTLGFAETTVLGRNFAGPDNITVAANRLKVSFTPVLLHLEDPVSKALRQADLIISTVPPQASARLTQTWQVRPEQQLLDVTYAQVEGGLTHAFESAGAKLSSPLVMLVAQGLSQVKLMSGFEAPFEPVLEAVEDADRKG